MRSAGNKLELLAKYRDDILESLDKNKEEELEIFLEKNNVKKEQIEEGEYFLKETQTPDGFQTHISENPVQGTVTLHAQQKVKFELYKKVDIKNTLAAGVKEHYDEV